MGMFLLSQQNFTRAELTLRGVLDAEWIADSLAALGTPVPGQMTTPWGELLWFPVTSACTGPPRFGLVVLVRRHPGIGLGLRAIRRHHPALARHLSPTGKPVNKAMVKRGTSLLEALLALVLFSLLVHGSLTILVRHREAGVDVAHRAEGLETVRTIAWLLPEEVSGGRVNSDWWAKGGDSLNLRAFRGTALIRGRTGSAPLVIVCFRGLRAPDPDKDSVLVLGGDGRWTAHDLQRRTPNPADCPGPDAGREEEWALSPAPVDPVFARVFERGSYHLADGALRYRRGEGGRQPLTPERIQEGEFLGSSEGGRPFAWEVSLLGPPRGRPDPAGPGARTWRGGVW